MEEKKPVYVPKTFMWVVDIQSCPDNRGFPRYSTVEVIKGVVKYAKKKNIPLAMAILSGYLDELNRHPELCIRSDRREIFGKGKKRRKVPTARQLAEEQLVCTRLVRWGTESLEESRFYHSVLDGVPYEGRESVSLQDKSIRFSPGPEVRSIRFHGDGRNFFTIKDLKSFRGLERSPERFAGERGTCKVDVPLENRHADYPFNLNDTYALSDYYCTRSRFAPDYHEIEAEEGEFGNVWVEYFWANVRRNGKVKVSRHPFRKMLGYEKGWIALINR